MQETLKLNPEVAERIISDAQTKGLPVEVYLQQIINAKREDKRIKVMREAINDDLFLADLETTMRDFRQVDFE